MKSFLPRREYSRAENEAAAMPIAAGERVVAQRATALPWERLANYLAAYACTLLTIAAAYPIAPAWCLGLALITCIGLPLSLELRRRDLRLGDVEIDRFVCNSVIVVLSGGLSLLYLGTVVPGLFNRSAMETAVNLGARLPDVMAMLVLIFVACRSLFVLTDKDAFRSLISFAVLFLLVVTQRTPALIVIFLLWAVAAMVLLALDHRAETRYDLGGVVPAPVPGQDVALSLRSLAGIVIFSLLCASSISFVIAGSDAGQSSSGENWIVTMLSRLGVPGLDSGTGSSPAATGRGINFSARPATLSQTPAWRVSAYDLTNKRAIRPAYWRLYSLSFYNGSTWLPNDRQTTRTAANFHDKARLRDRSRDRVPLQDKGDLEALPQAPGYGTAPRRFYDLAKKASPNREKTFGAPESLVQQRVESLGPNGTFVPLLPVALRLALIRSALPEYVEAHADASVEGVAMTEGRVALVWSRTPRANANDPAQHPPPQLDATERARTSQLPETLPPRVLALARRLADETNRSAAKTSRGATATRDKNGARVLAAHSDAARFTSSKTEREMQLAARLSAFVRDGASYTLSPPPLPAGRDATEFFLFETHAGYCTHFASSLAILCRAAGLPSRIISGYVDPEWDAKDGSGLLREAAAHAWTEVWIDGRGWMTFDATPPDDRGDNAPTVKRTFELWWRGLLESAQRALGRVLPYGAALLAALIVGFALLFSKARFAHSSRHASQPFEDETAAPDDAVRRDVLSTFADWEKRIAREYRVRAAAETPRQWLQKSPRVLAGEQENAAAELLALRDRALYQTRPLASGAGGRARELLQLLA